MKKKKDRRLPAAEQTAPAKPSRRGVAETLLILLVLLLVLQYAAGILRGKGGRDNILAGQVSPEAHYDVIFAGSSHMNNAVYPMELWEAYGYTSFNNAQSGEVIPVSYYTCQYAVETYRPRVLVLDLYMLYHGKKDGSISWMHQALDPLPVKYRIPAVLDLVPSEKRKEFLAPLSLYHARWKELGKRDFSPADNVRRGGAQNFTLAEDIIGLSFAYEPPEVKQQPNDIAVSYLDKIAALCEQTDTQLLLVALPYFMSPELTDATHDLSHDQAYFNWAADYAAEKDIPYINFFHLTEDIGFDWEKCLYNYSHMNYWGGMIVTEYIGEYLSAHYDLPDHRGESAYAHWDSDLKSYRAEVEKNLEKAAI